MCREGGNLLKTFRIYAVLFFFITGAGLALAQIWTTYIPDNSGLAGGDVRAICVDQSGAIWFGTDNGLSRFDGVSWTSYTTADSLAHNSVNAIVFEMTDYGPEILVATEGGVSVISVDPDAITLATPYRTGNTGLVSDTVLSAAVDTSHVKWFGTTGGISTFNGRNWETFTSADLLSHDIITSISHSPEDNMIFYGTAGNGAGRFDGISEATPWHTRWTKIASDTVNVVYIDSGGFQWFGTDKGLSHHFGSKMNENWTTYTTEDGLADDIVRAIAEGPGGIMWIGTDNGVSSFDGASWNTYTAADGLTGNVVRAIAADTDGTLWFGTNNGVSHFDPRPVAVETDQQRTFSINCVYPNPFNIQTTIVFTNPLAGTVTLEVYNLTGQKVRELVGGYCEPGLHTVVWNGLDRSEMSVSSGLYLVRLSAGVNSAVGRMMLVK